MRCPKCRVENIWGNYCDTCNKSYSIDGVWTAANYKDLLLNKLVKTLKYQFIKDISTILAKILIIHFNNICIKSRLNLNESNHIVPKVLINKSDTIVIPVPLHKKRERWRGFNQSAEIAKCFTNYTGLTIDNQHLVRIKNTKPQTKKSKYRRQRDLANSFSWRGDSLYKKNIILLDDVITTGSTLNECAKALKAAKANEVWGIVIASG